MLRGRQTANSDGRSETEYPSFEEAYTVGDQPVGILFYQPNESFFLPYSLLAAMHLSSDRLILTFTAEDVIIEGRGLHELYLRLAEHKVARICQQGDRFAQSSSAQVFVSVIQRVFREQAELGSGLADPQLPLSP